MCVCACGYVCVCVYMYMYMYIYIHMCVWLCVCVCIYIYLYMYKYIHIYMYVYTYVYIYIYIFVCICTCIFMYIYIYIHIYMQRRHISCFKQILSSTASCATIYMTTPGSCTNSSTSCVLPCIRKSLTQSSGKVSSARQSASTHDCQQRPPSYSRMMVKPVQKDACAPARGGQRDERAQVCLQLP